MKKRRTPAMVMWYLPVISQLRRLISNPRNAEMMTWYFDKHNKKDGKLQHPADGSQWRKIDGKYRDFGREHQNVSTDGINPFGDLSSTYST